MIASVAFIVPTALSTVLFAVGAGNPSSLRKRIKFTLSLSVLIGGLASGALIIGAGFILNLFGSAYAAQAELPMRILSLGVFPLIIKVHYITIVRIYGRLNRAAFLMMVSALLEIALAATGANLGGLLGISLGWLVALCAEAVFMAPVVYRAATGSSRGRQTDTNPI
jgi:O-antigen/teichoic acid export membrane protein